MFALHVTLHSKPDTRSISARDRPGIRDTQPDPYGLPVSRSHSRSGVGEFSLGLSPISVGFRYLLHEIGPMTRNPERDTERSQVVHARSPSLITRISARKFIWQFIRNGGLVLSRSWWLRALVVLGSIVVE